MGWTFFLFCPLSTGNKLLFNYFTTLIIGFDTQKSKPPAKKYTVRHNRFVEIFLPDFWRWIYIEHSFLLRHKNNSIFQLQSRGISRNNIMGHLTSSKLMEFKNAFFYGQGNWPRWQRTYYGKLSDFFSNDDKSKNINLVFSQVFRTKESTSNFCSVQSA